MSYTSFSLQVKDELSKIAPKNKMGAIVEIAAILNFSKSLNKKNCLIYSEHSGVIDFLIDYLSMEVDGISPLILATSKNPKKKNTIVYCLYAKNDHDFELIRNMFLPENSIQIYKLEENRENRISFLRGAFLACGSMNNPQKEYQLEFVLNDYNQVEILSYVLDFYNFAFKTIERKNYFVLYIKDSECIEDILTLMGATKSSLSIMQIKIMKNVRNKINRVTNCETANIDKTISASYKQIKNIDYLIKTGVFETLPDNLKKTAEIRKKHPEMSLKEIAAKLGDNVTKSCINHRLNKISKIADVSRKENK